MNVNVTAFTIFVNESTPWFRSFEVVLNFPLQLLLEHTASHYTHVVGFLLFAVALTGCVGSHSQIRRSVEMAVMSIGITSSYIILM